MKIKTVYFVRHGESEGNVGEKWQDSNAKLTADGREQARLAGDRFINKPIDIILSSTMERGKETAEIISKRIGKDIEFSDLFIERRRPKEQIGHDKNAVSVAFVDEVIRENFSDPKFRFSDEENFEDLKVRAGKLLKFLYERKEDNIVVVTHGFFMRMIIGYVTHGEDLNAKEGEQFVRTFHMDNTGITTIKSNENDNNSSWDVYGWNDCEHLIESTQS